LQAGFSITAESHGGSEENGKVTEKSKASSVESPSNTLANSSIAASFRDPGGALFVQGNRIVRAIHPSAAPTFEALLTSATGRQLVESGKLVSSRVLPASEADEILRDPCARAIYDGVGAAMLVEHERIWFPSFPYEWSAGMLHAAADLTLELASAFLPDPSA
jgi:hypothetical protein